MDAGDCNLGTAIWKNPFVLRQVWLRHRRVLAGPNSKWWVAVLALLGLWMVPGGLAGWTAVAFLGLTLQALYRGLAAWTLERESGALESMALIPLSPWKEALGRWFAAGLDVFRFWLWSSGFVIAWAFVLADPKGILTAVLFWIFGGCWLAALVALGLVCSCIIRRPDGALACALTGLLGWTLVVVCLGMGDPAPYLAPNVATPFTLLENPGSLPVFAWAVSSWSLFTILLWVLATVLIGRRISHGACRMSFTSPLVRRRRRREERPFGVLGSVALVAYRNNPLYRAFLRGYTDNHSIVNFCCTSCLAGLTAVLLASFPRTASSLGTLVIVLGLIFLLVGLVAGTSAMSRERNGGAWPVLVATGLSPKSIAEGKFAITFHELTPSWLLPLPFWLVLGLGSAPAIVLLCIEVPLCLALGVAAGISSGASTRARQGRSAMEYVVLALAAMFGLPILFGGISVVVVATWPVWYYLSPVVIVDYLMGTGGTVPSGVALLATQVMLGLGILRLLLRTAPHYVTKMANASLEQ